VVIGFIIISLVSHLVRHLGRTVRARSVQGKKRKIATRGARFGRSDVKKGCLQDFFYLGNEGKVFEKDQLFKRAIFTPFRVI
jgi:hypothetical protein